MYMNDYDTLHAFASRGVLCTAVHRAVFRSQAAFCLFMTSRPFTVTMYVHTYVYV